jgi:hypothetical protein
LLDDEVHVVVEVTTDDDQSIWVLTNDISNDIGDSLCSLMEVLLFTWLKVAVQNLYVGVAHLYLGPAQIRPKCLHQLQSGVGSRRIPTPTIALQQCLVRPEPTQVEWALQLGLVEADYLRSIMLQEIIDDLLLVLGVQSSHIEGN